MNLSQNGLNNKEKIKDILENVESHLNSNT